MTLSIWYFFAQLLTFLLSLFPSCFCDLRFLFLTLPEGLLSYSHDFYLKNPRFLSIANAVRSSSFDFRPSSRS